MLPMSVGVIICAAARVKWLYPPIGLATDNDIMNMCGITEYCLSLGLSIYLAPLTIR